MTGRRDGANPDAGLGRGRAPREAHIRHGSRAAGAATAGGRGGRFPACALMVLAWLLPAGGTPCAQGEEASPAFEGARPVSATSEHLDGTPFKSPQGIYYDAANDEIFIADSGNGLIGIFDGRGVPKFTFSPARRGSYPVDMGTDAEGNIYVAIAGSRLLRIFNYRGEPLREIDVSEVRGVRGAPAGVAVSPEGVVYLLDSLGKRILIYGRDGELLSVIQGSGRGGERLQAPTAIALAPDGDLYVTDNRGPAVQVYSTTGRYLRGWGRKGMGRGDFSVPGGIAVDEKGLVYVTDIQKQEIRVFDAAGRSVGSFGTIGRQAGQFGYPSDIAAGAGRLFVVERVNRRIQIFERLALEGEPERAPAGVSTPEAGEGAAEGDRGAPVSH